MSDIRKDLSKIFKKSVPLSESLEEGFLDDVKDQWSKSKELAKSPIKNLAKEPIKNLAKKMFVRKPKKRVNGTGTSSSSNDSIKPIMPKVAPAQITTPSPKPTETINIPPEKFGADSKAPISKPTPVPAAVAPKEIPKNDDAVIIDPSGRNIVHPDKPLIILNPKGIELQGVEDSNQKEKKIINPLRNLLKNKNKDFTTAFNKIKEKNGITSKNSIEEISTKEPSDVTRKVIIRNLFAIKYYKDAYENLLENLRNMNIISENKIDFGTFQQAILNSLDRANQKHNRRYSANIRKINQLSKNENDVKLGLRKGISSFKRDMNEIYKSNKDNFTMKQIQESVNFEAFFYEGIAYEAAPANIVNPEEQKDKEDNTVKMNDYVWWIDSNELQKVMTDPEKRKQLRFEGNPIEFQDIGNGKFIDGTSAVVKFLNGPKNGESEKIDIRNLDIPQDLAKSMVGFGKVIGDASQQKQIGELDKKIADAEAQLKMPSITSKDVKDINDDIFKYKKEKEQVTQKGSFNVAKVQRFIPKDINSLDKTIAGGKTKITPDPSNKTTEVLTSDLVKLNKEGKSKLLSVIGKSFIVFHALFNLLKGTDIAKILNGLNAGLADLAKKYGDLAGSKNLTNF
jgi:hypothetical protein